MSMLIYWVVRTCGQKAVFLRNGGMYPQVHTASQPRRATSIPLTLSPAERSDTVSYRCSDFDLFRDDRELQ
jgi:hypothetical protein